MSETTTEATPTAKPKRKRTNVQPLRLPPAGVGPNTFANVMRSQNALADRVSQLGDAQAIGKRYFRPFLREHFADAHEKHAGWQLTQPMMRALLARFGNERGQALAKRKAAK